MVFSLSACVRTCREEECRKRMKLLKKDLITVKKQREQEVAVSQRRECTTMCVCARVCVTCSSAAYVLPYKFITHAVCSLPLCSAYACCVGVE